MPRTDNVFYNLVTNENSTTELLCNLMRFSAFRTSFLRLFLEEGVASGVRWDEIETQLELPDCGRPDLRIDSIKVVALIEVKVTPYLGLTNHQPTSYIRFLSKDTRPQRWLVFLVPRRWFYIESLRETLGSISASTARGVQTRFIYWEDVVELIAGNDLAALSPFFSEFSELICERIVPKPITFSTREVFMLFSNEVPETLAKLQRVIDGVKNQRTDVRPSAPKALCPEEYGMYFLDAEEKPVLWFGMWMNFWKEHGFPLCFGVEDKWPDEVQGAFRRTCKGPTKHFDKYTVAWFTQEDFAADNVIDRVWARIAPVLDAVTKAAAKKTGAKA